MMLRAFVRNPHSQELFRYGIAGLINTLASFVVYSFFVIYTDVPFWIANFFALITGISTGFFLSRYFVFAGVTKSNAGTAVKYVCTMCSQYALSTTLIAAFIALGASEIVSYLIALPFIIALSFVLQKVWVFQVSHKNT